MSEPGNSSIVECPSCQRKLRVPNDLQSKKVKCPTCAVMFYPIEAIRVEEAAEVTSPNADQPPPLVAPESPAMPPPLPTGMETPLSRSAPEQREIARRFCPFCGEAIQAKAVRCPICREVLDDTDDDEPKGPARSQPFYPAPPSDNPYRTGSRAEEGYAGPRRDCEPHRGVMILVLGIISICTTWMLIGLPLGITAWVMGQGDLQRMRLQQLDPEGKDMTQIGMICGIIGTFLSTPCICCLGWGFVGGMH